MDSFLTDNELYKIGFKSIGKNVYISRKASLYSPESMELGDHVRIDDFCILSGKIQIGNYVHIAAYSALYASQVGITIRDFCNLSSRVIIYAISDDFSGNSLTNPMVPDKYKNLIKSPVKLNKHVIIGSGTTVLPGVVIEEGVAIGAHSLISKDCLSWSIYAGCPAKRISDRSKKLLELEKQFLKTNILSNDK